MTSSANGRGAKVAIVNGMIFDCTGADPFEGEVLISGTSISAVERGRGSVPQEDATIVDARGCTVMSGLCDAHAHLSWIDQHNRDAIRNMPLEEHTLATLRNAKRYLECGYTMLVSGGSAKPRLDVAVRDAIERGDFAGPRLLANGPIVTSSRDTSEKEAFEHRRFADVEIINGPDSIREAVDRIADLRTDLVKFTMSGEEIVGVPAQETLFTEDEIRAGVQEARARGLRICAHARSADSVRMCAENAVDFIYHASYVDDSVLAALDRVRDRVFVAPGINWLYTTAHEAADWGVTPQRAAELGYPQELETATEGMRRMRERGIRLLPGGDYGFAWCPHGTYARDLEHFVRLFGFSASETLVAATCLGAEAMGRQGDLGVVRPGYRADLLVVDGDPTKDIRILQDTRRIKAVLKDGSPVIPSVASRRDEAMRSTPLSSRA